MSLLVIQSPGQIKTIEFILLQLGHQTMDHRASLTVEPYSLVIHLPSSLVLLENTTIMTRLTCGHLEWLWYQKDSRMQNFLGSLIPSKLKDKTIRQMVL